MNFDPARRDTTRHKRTRACLVVVVVTVLVTDRPFERVTLDIFVFFDFESAIGFYGREGAARDGGGTRRKREKASLQH